MPDCPLRGEVAVMPCLSRLPHSYAAIRAALGELPSGPGVYEFRDRAGHLLYVGKSVCLRERVRSYFGTAAGRCRKLRRLRSQVSAVEWTETGSELEALLVESRRVKEHHPPFNTLLHRHRYLAFLRLDLADPFPRLEVTETLRRDGARYFGPFTLSADAERLAEILSDTLRLRTCDPPGDRVPRTAPCLRRDLGLCLAPCVEPNSAAVYAEAVCAAALVFEREGRPFRDRLRAEMAAAAERLLFERAARLRDALRSLEALAGRQQAVLSAVDALDVVTACPSHRPRDLELFLFHRGCFVAQHTLARESLLWREAALSAARELLSCRREGENLARPSPAGALTGRGSSLAPARAMSAVEPEVLDQLFIITRWLRRNSGEGRHFLLPAGEAPNRLALRLGGWLSEVAAELGSPPGAPGDPASAEAQLLADWAEERE